MSERSTPLTLKPDGDDNYKADNVADETIGSYTLKPIHIIGAPTGSLRTILTERVPNTITFLDEENFSSNQAQSVDTISVFFGNTPQKIPPGPTLILFPDGDSDLWTVTTDKSTPATPLPAIEEAGDDLHKVFLWFRPQFEAVQDSMPWNDIVFEDLIRLDFNDSAMNFGQPAQISTLVVNQEGKPLVTYIDRANPIIILHAKPDRSDIALRREFIAFLTSALDVLGLQTTKMQSIPVMEANDNLIDRRESNFRQHDAIASTEGSIVFKGPGSGHPIWVFCLAAALVLALTEWFLFHRRVTF